MTIALRTPTVAELAAALDVLASWQTEEAPFQLHPGDIGWFWRHGPEAAAAAVRTWSRDGSLVALGLLDEPDLLRLAIAPGAHQDHELAQQLADDIADPDSGVLPAGTVTLEVARDVLLHDLLDENGWARVDPWPILHHDLASVDEHGLRIQVITEQEASVWAHVHGAAWGGGPSDEAAVEARWHRFAGGPAFANARCLVGWDQEDNAVATVTVWAAGPGRHGIVEPMGVHPDHRGKGHGRAMNLAAASALLEMGSTSAMVATPGSNVGAVAAYEAAGFRSLYERLDRRRDS
ncbi:GNAT family N-acetyltransferase [Ornithinimicrobium faecis]|uniref:GNAT family N-acetyltransferase n=1 Tax=Ornithinimicrobium faecis TaxID=2934158 RepID=A0ABY4YTA0_9MICO|nr:MULTISPECIES: GNAT family N-acetyltransferase [unclassified Ornithinimicrobium]USQ80004.1 GNAT family N-acetyltransferase [Ornithinimicrobium sp. HY1793]